jgi:SMI1 / KNR4 family (SUKH-1)
MPDRYFEKKAVLPTSYVEFIETSDGSEGDLGEELGYVALWAKESIQERWDAYEMASCLSDRWFPFGSNGGGEMLCFDLDSGGDGVCWMSYIGMSDEDAMQRAYSFKDIAQTINEKRRGSSTP